MVVAQQPKLTYEDYRNTLDDKRYELHDGELILSPSPRTNHQRLERRLFLRTGLIAEE